MGNYRDRSKWRFDGTIRAAFLREFVGTPLLGGSIDGNPMLTFMSSNTTITPAITLSGDGPCQWEVTEVDGAKYYYSANSFSHTRSVAGNMIVRLLNTVQVAPYVTQLDFNGDGIVSSIYSLQLGLFVNMTQLRLYTNQLTGNIPEVNFPAKLTVLIISSNKFTGDLVAAKLPAGLTVLNLRSNLITGDLPSVVLPTGLTYLNLSINQLTGDLATATLPTGLTELYLYSNQLTGNLSTTMLQSGLTTLEIHSNQLTGLYTVSNPTAMQDYRAQDQGVLNMTQARIDAFVTDIYSKRTYFTYATPTFNIGGTNANPSGIYQNPFPNPPATPLEMLYVLVNDPFTEGFNKQIWTY